MEINNVYRPSPSSCFHVTKDEEWILVVVWVNSIAPAIVEPSCPGSRNNPWGSVSEMADLAELLVGCRRLRRVVEERDWSCEAEPWLWAGVCRMMNSWMNSLEVLVLCLYRKWWSVGSIELLYLKFYNSMVGRYKLYKVANPNEEFLK